MAIHVNISKDYIENSSSKELEPKDAVAHHIPFKILANGDAPVARYFTPTIRKSEGGDLKCSFRGHPILGRTCQIPEGLCGYVILDKKSTECEGADRNVHVVGKFSKYYFWDNKSPPKNVSLLATIGLANLIHSPTDSS